MNSILARRNVFLSKLVDSEIIHIDTKVELQKIDESVSLTEAYDRIHARQWMHAALIGKALHLQSAVDSVLLLRSRGLVAELDILKGILRFVSIEEALATIVLLLRLPESEIGGHDLKNERGLICYVWQPSGLTMAIEITRYPTEWKLSIRELYEFRLAPGCLILSPCF